MQRIAYKINIDDISGDVDKNYFFIRDLLYKIAIIVIKDLDLLNIVIEENNYNGLLSLFSVDNSIELVKESIVDFRYSKFFINFYEELKLLLDKSRRNSSTIIINIEIISCNEVQLVVKYLVGEKDGKIVYSKL